MAVMVITGIMTLLGEVFSPKGSFIREFSNQKI